jgi:hypothetical protein
MTSGAVQGHDSWLDNQPATLHLRSPEKLDLEVQGLI